MKSQDRSFNQDTNINYKSDLPKRNGFSMGLEKNTLDKREKKERTLDICNIVLKGKIERDNLEDEWVYRKSKDVLKGKNTKINNLMSVHKMNGPHFHRLHSNQIF